MAVWRFVVFSVKEAQLLADLTGVEVDLRATEEICDLILQNMAKEPMELLLVESLCAAALIRYGRSFGSGVRHTIPDEVVKGLPSESQKNHEFFKNLRDKWIAHSVNAFEENLVHAYLTPEERGPRSISSISVQHSRIVTLRGNNIAALKTLAVEMRKQVEILIDQEKKKVLEYARSLPVDNFYSQVDPPAKAPGGDPKKRRKNF
ncbi:MAG: hypothetical protein PHD01_03255 [Geobacteraceae bacterium]|nr:hypothetical protein [Geobacteraceae bacterium]